MLKLAYQIGVKLALLAGENKLVSYPGIPRNTDLVGDDANASYDQLLAILQEQKAEEALRRFDTQEAPVDSPSDTNPSAPVTSGSFYS